ncbi:MAG: radical SAM protein [Planctomycetaceae bacterium]|jgi:radical SAM protein with 4Fe4S-binding SPASM domain|nr:radical SAM protein [Planctomycetaceae bacterium]
MKRIKLPQTAVLEMTYRCNHRCVFCSCAWFAGRYEILPELDILQWRTVINMLRERGVTIMSFTGGEPLLKEGLFEIMTHAIKSGVHIHLLSNGCAMSDEVLQFCSVHQVQLSMSLPGLTTFSEHTDSNTQVENILSWFKKAHELGITTVAGITVTKRNLPELFETAAEALLAGADTILLNRFMPGGRGLFYRNWELNHWELLEMLETVEEVLKIANRYGSVGTELPRCLIDPSKYKHLRTSTNCNAATHFFAVDPSGYVRVCNHSEVRLVHWKELDKLIDHEYWKIFTQRKFIPLSCMHCELTFCCAGGCREAAHIVGGQVESPDPLLLIV